MYEASGLNGRVSSFILAPYLIFVRVLAARNLLCSILYFLLAHAAIPKTWKRGDAIDSLRFYLYSMNWARNSLRKVNGFVGQQTEGVLDRRKGYESGLLEINLWMDEEFIYSV